MEISACEGAMCGRSGGVPFNIGVGRVRTAFDVDTGTGLPFHPFHKRRRASVGLLTGSVHILTDAHFNIGCAFVLAIESGIGFFRDRWFFLGIRFSRCI